MVQGAVRGGGESRIVQCALHPSRNRFSTASTASTAGRGAALLLCPAMRTQAPLKLHLCAGPGPLHTIVLVCGSPHLFLLMATFLCTCGPILFCAQMEMSDCYLLHRSLVIGAGVFAQVCFGQVRG